MMLKTKKMKNDNRFFNPIYILTIFILLLNSALVMSEERQSLLTRGSITSGGFGGPVMRMSQIDGNTQYMLGMRAAWLINHRYYIGMAGYRSLNETGKTDLALGYGGILLGMRFQPTKLIHFSTDLLGGAGGIFDSAMRYSNRDQHDRADKIFIIEPTASLHVNLTPYTELSIGTSYRFVTQSNHAQLDNKTLSGLLANFSIIFGKF